MRDQYMRVADGFLVVYSITDKLSFDDMDRFIEQILAVKEVDQVPMVVIGNKCDLEVDRQVETYTGEKFAEKRKAAFLETSVKFGINIDEAFASIANDVVRMRTVCDFGQENKLERKKACVVC